MQSTEIDTYVDDCIAKRLVHEIHTSERKSFRGCRRRWDWIFHDFYYPKMTAKPLEFGIAFHKAMETLYNPEMWKLPPQVRLANAMVEFTKVCEEQRANYLVNTQKFDLELDDKEDYDERIAMGLAMLQYYMSNIAPDVDALWKPVSVEKEFLVPIQNPDNNEYLFCKCDQCFKKAEASGAFPSGQGQFEGLPVCLGGRVDMFAQDIHGDYWIVDWKTAAQLSKEYNDSFLQLDDQINSYVMAFRRKLGVNVRGFLYVELRKAVAVTEPKRNKVKRLGRWYSVSKSQAIQADVYREFVAANDPDAYQLGAYDEFIQKLEDGGSVFHWRYMITKTDTELEEIERNLYNEALDMIDPNLRIYPSAGKFNCSWCAFRQPCMEKNAGSNGDPQYLLDTLFDKRTKHYWVKDLSTDSQGGE